MWITCIEAALKELARRGFRRIRAAWLLLPRPPARNFQLQREAKEGPDQHDNGQDPNAFERRSDSHGANDVGGDQEFEAQQDGPAQQLPVETVNAEVFSTRRQVTRLVPAECQRNGNQRTDDHNGHPGKVDELSDRLNDVPKIHGSLPHSRRVKVAAVQGTA